MLRLRKEALTFEDFVTDRLGKYSSDESITSLAEFVVQKITTRHSVGTIKNIYQIKDASDLFCLKIHSKLIYWLVWRDSFFQLHCYNIDNCFSHYLMQKLQDKLFLFA